MPVPTVITDLVPVAADNSPAGTDTIGMNMDNYIRAHASFISQLYGLYQDQVNRVISVMDYGATGDGVTDDTSAIQDAIDAAEGQHLLFEDGTYLITSALTLPSNIYIYASPGAVIQSATTSINLMSAVSKTNIVINGLHFKYTAAGGTATIGGVSLNTCTNCIVDKCRFEGCQYSGVILIDSSNCVITNNHIYSTQGTHTDANDICVMDDSNDNLIESNRCLGDGVHGIFVLGTGTATPLRNRLISNVIDGKTGYGIVVYQITAADTDTIISNNMVYDIAGTGIAGASGSGIYVQTAGGAVVTGNTIRNCCISTSSATNLPAGISIAFNGALRKPVVVSGNNVNAPKWSGIAIATGACEASVVGNVVEFADGTNGTGIQVVDASNVVVSGNKVSAATTVARSGINVYATANDMENIVISGNAVKGTNGNLINFTRTSGSYTIQAAVTGNVCTSTGASSQALVGLYLVDSTISGNTLIGVTSGLYVQDVVRVRGAGNVCAATTNVFLSGGTCTDTYFDDSNQFTTNTTAIQNTAAGCNIEIRFNQAPASGNWQIGDRVCQSVPAAGQPKGWRCTVAGAPGTWVSEGNL